MKESDDDDKTEKEEEKKKVEEKKEEKKEEENNDPKEEDLLLVKPDSKSSKDDYRDILLLNDLDFFYKTGKFPFIFFSHLLCTALVTIIILSQKTNLTKLMEHERAMQSSFYFHDGTEDPDYDFAKQYYYTDYDAFSENLVKIINNIYEINNTLDFNINFENQDYLRMFTKFRNSNSLYKKNIKEYNVTYPYFLLLAKDVDPLKYYFNNDTEVIKHYLSQIEELDILLRYEYDRLDHGACQIVNLNLLFDCTNVQYIKYYLKFTYDECPRNFERIKTGFTQTSSFFSLVLLISGIFEVIFTLKKILAIIKIVFYIKENLSQENFLDNLNLNKQEMFFMTGESKWDLIKNRDIMTLFPKWLFLFVITGLINTLGGIAFIINPFMNSVNRILFSLGAFLNWISFAYFFNSSKKYNLFYRTLFKSMSEYKYLFTTFIILFTGFCLLNMCVHYHIGKFYNGFLGTFTSIFSLSFGDTFVDILYTTFFDTPLTTLILAFIMFIIFLGIHLNVMSNVTQEMYQIVNLETKKSWLDNNFDLKDYLNQKFNIAEEDDDGEEEKKDFIFDDAWMRAVLNIDNTNKLENIDLKVLKGKGVASEVIVKSLKKIRKNNRNKKISKEIYEEIMEEEGHTELEILEGKNKQISRAFKSIEKMFGKMYSKIKEDNNFANKEKFKEICKQSVEKLEDFKKEISNDL